MSLIRCPECGNSISDRAEKCPHCGLPASYFSSLSKNAPHTEETGLDYKNLQNVLISFERDRAQLFSAEHYISHGDAQRLRNTYGKYNESLTNKLIFQYVCNNAAAIRVDIDSLRRFLRQMQSLDGDITAHNSTYVDRALERDKDYFDNILKQIDPNIQLDEEQRQQQQHHRGDELAVCDGLANLCTALKAEGIDQADAEAGDRCPLQNSGFQSHCDSSSVKFEFLIQQGVQPDRLAPALWAPAVGVLLCDPFCGGAHLLGCLLHRQTDAADLAVDGFVGVVPGFGAFHGWLLLLLNHNFCGEKKNGPISFAVMPSRSLMRSISSCRKTKFPDSFWQNWPSLKPTFSATGSGRDHGCGPAAGYNPSVPLLSPPVWNVVVSQPWPQCTTPVFKCQQKN